ncbi:hypothetical protein CPJCM30710_09850 [Clostridium polyendosporum]|uniref:Radical SAM core domain-containing protein n=1 Tax=Clostridium polyendosporum TaxID=69208 RepID=A0A919VDR9_9CLOT|nr:radical SAM protein [Clostridium polyendosporum]GIM28319.1 hypothetical protein CPJCM30710_09850 [Clostridium polyendosporum]
MINNSYINIFHISGDTIPYELLFLTGHLDYHEIQYKIYEINWKDPVLPEVQGENFISIIFASKYDEKFIILNRLRAFLEDFGKVIIIGWLASYKRDELVDGLSENEILIYGDYQKTLSELLKTLIAANGADGWLVFGGSPIRGELWNPDEYLMTECDSYIKGKTGYVLYSTGCNRICAYCSCGANYKSVYNEADLIRKRKTVDVFNDIERLYKKDIKRIRLVAEQVLHEDFEKNHDFFQLCEMLNSSGLSDIRLEFTTSTFDVVQNIGILERAAKKVNLALYLNIDFVSQDVLDKFKLPSSLSSHREALKFCSKEKIPFNINYIFYHPWLNEKGINDLIGFLKETSGYFSHNPTPFGYLVITQMLLTSFRPSSYEPSDPVLKAEELTVTPTPKVSNFSNILFKVLSEHKEWFAPIVISYEKEEVSRFIDILERLFQIIPSHQMDEYEENDAVSSILGEFDV